MAYIGNEFINGWSPSPQKHFGVVSAGAVLVNGPGGNHNFSGCIALAFYPSADGVLTYNGQSGCTEPVYADSRNIIVVNEEITQIVPSVSGIVIGMVK